MTHFIPDDIRININSPYVNDNFKKVKRKGLYCYAIYTLLYNDLDRAELKKEIAERFDLTEKSANVCITRLYKYFPIDILDYKLHPETYRRDINKVEDRIEVFKNNAFISSKSGLKTSVIIKDIPYDMDSPEVTNIKQVINDIVPGNKNIIITTNNPKLMDKAVDDFSRIRRDNEIKNDPPKDGKVKRFFKKLYRIVFGD